MGKMWVLCLFVVIGLCSAGSAQFTDVGAGLGGAARGTIAWGDYDNDGDLDLARTGDMSGTLISRIYRNSGGVFSDIGAGLAGVDSGSLAWGDFDNDGDLDLARAGYTGQAHINRIYRNDNGVFTDIQAGLMGMYQCSLAWSDYDNDGDLDIAVGGYNGEDQVTKLYRNDGLTFTDATSGFGGRRQCSLAWGDYDNDGDADLAIAGYMGTARVSRIYRNDGAGIFTNIDAGLVGVSHCSLAWGDYDNDGDLDLALAGDGGGYYYTKIYRNDGEDTFADASAGFGGRARCSLAWADYDNDGDLDIAIAGYSGSHAISRIYRNNAGAFTDIEAGLVGVMDCSLAWGDYDNDGDLDLALQGETDTGAYVAKVYRNDGTYGGQSPQANNPPTPPTGLWASVCGHEITFTWETGWDAETAGPGLSYNLRVGTTPGGSDVVAPGANLSTGLRRLPATGNAHQNLSWTIRGLHPNRYYWSVQSIDTAFAGSQWSAEQSAVHLSVLKREADGVEVDCSAMIVTAAFADSFYIEADDRSCGIRVHSPGHTVLHGMRVDVAGTLATNSDGERQVVATSTSQHGSLVGNIDPMLLVNRGVGGGDWHYDPQTRAGQQGVKDAPGRYSQEANNIGLLVATSGRVTYLGSDYFYVDDGTVLDDESGHIGVKVLADGLSIPVQNSHVIVTGISSCFKSGDDLYRRILTRGPWDMRKVMGL